MALIVEDGSGVDGAESYISVEEADTYHASRGNTGWAPLDEERKEQLLRHATDYLRQVYRSLWKGTPVFVDHSVDWPRMYVYYDETNLDTIIAEDVIPVELQQATAVLALQANSGPLMPNATRRVTREKIGPLEREFDKYGPSGLIYSAVGSTLSILLKSGSGGLNADLVRA